MKPSGHTAQSSISRQRARSATAAPTIFIDLDGTLVWTWEPLIINDFMSKVFGLPICKPPKPKDGFLRITQVLFEDGMYSLTSRRPNITRFLRSLRALGDVCLLTHAPRDYALTMNRAFALGFADDQIFTIPADVQTLIDRFALPQKLTLLIDDEGPGRNLNWRRPWSYEGYDHRADNRHREKCLCLGITPRSRRDIPYPKFAGRKDDPFLRTALRRSIVQRVAKAIQRHRRKGSR